MSLHGAPGVVGAQRVGGRLTHQFVGVVQQADQRLLGVAPYVAEGREEKRRGSAHLRVGVLETGEERFNGCLADLDEDRGGGLAAALGVVADVLDERLHGGRADLDEEATGAGGGLIVGVGIDDDRDQLRGELAQALQSDARLCGDGAVVDDLTGRVGHGRSLPSPARGRVPPPRRGGLAYIGAPWGAAPGPSRGRRRVAMWSASRAKRPLPV